MVYTDLERILPAEFPDSARVWIYQGSRPFTDKEESEINEQLYHFYAQWQSHGMPVKGWAKLLFRQFVVIMADETETMVGGCSTDSSVRVVKSLERQYSVNFFDRLMLTFLIKNKAQMLPFSQVQYAIDNGLIDADTPVFNNVIATKKELTENWLVPLKQSWLTGKVSLKQEKLAG